MSTVEPLPVSPAARDGSVPVVTRAATVHPARLAGLVAAPYVLLLLAAVGAWAWRRQGLPDIAGSLTPVGVVLAVACVVLAVAALRARLPLAWLTWLPAGQGAAALLATGLLARDFIPQAQVWATAGYVLVFLLVLVLGALVAKHGAHLAVVMVCLFLLAQAMRVPVFEVEAAVALDGAVWYTAAAAVRALAELVLLTWLTCQVVGWGAGALPVAPPGVHGGTSDVPRRYVFGLVALTAGHGLIAGWQDPALRGTLSVGAVVEQALTWLVFAGVQLGLVMIVARLRSPWFRQPESPMAETVPAGPALAVGATPAVPTTNAGRPRRRERRRR